jgi:hypothetical protein
MDGITQPLNGGISSYKAVSGPPKEGAEDERQIPADVKSPCDTFDRSADKACSPAKKKSAPPSSQAKGGHDAHPSKSRELKEYTILNYMDGCNNLEDCILEDFVEMENCPPSSNYNLVAQFSRFQTKPLTALFFAEALSQAFKNGDFKAALENLVQDRDLVQNYESVLKDPEVCQNISTILLQKNPELQDKIDSLVSAKAKEALGQNRSLKDVIGEIAADVLKGIAHNEKQGVEQSDNKTDKKVQGGAVMTAMEGSLPSTPSLLDIMGDSAPPKNGSMSEDFVRATAEFLKGAAGKGPVGLFAGSGTPTSPAPTGRGNNVFFVETGGLKGKKLEEGDYSSLFEGVDGARSDKEPAWRGVRRYEITHTENSTRINSPVLDDMGQVDMSKGKTLVDFLSWGMKKYPAKHYIVVFSDHGAGFLGAEEDRGNMMSMPAIKEALDKVAEKTGVKPDIIAFDTCLMGQVEVANELKDSAKYLIASEETIGGDGFPYSEILPRIDASISEGKTDPKDIAKIFIEEGENASEDATVTLSAIDLEAISTVVGAANTLAKHILEGKADIEDVSESIKYTQHYSVGMSPMEPYEDFRDLWDMADKMENNPNIKNRDIKQDLKELKKAVEAAVVFEEHSDDEDYEGSHGISIYAPRRQKTVSVSLMEEYDQLMMSKRTKWNELIKTLIDYDEINDQESDDRSRRISFLKLPPRRQR